MRPTAFTAAGAAALLLTLTACGADGGTAQAGGAGDGEGGGGAETKTVCFAFQDIETEFWAAGIQSITASIEEKGWEVTQKNSQGDANKQLEQINDCIAQGVDGIIIIPQDGTTVINMIGAANAADIPIGVFARPPADNNPNKNIQVVADNETIARSVNEFLAEQVAATGKKVKPLIMVGDLGDPNAVLRKRGFDAVIEANPDLFEEPVEVATEWDAETARAGLQSAMQSNPDVGMIFTSSDFLYPQIEAVLQPLGKWVPIGDANHIILGGLDGDNGACNLMRDQYVDATGVMNLFEEADMIVASLAEAIEQGDGQKDEDLFDEGFALTQANFGEKEQDTWGCVIEPPK
jgi:ABC-type sugar transport system substrate-binding protein